MSTDHMELRYELQCAREAKSPAVRIDCLLLAELLAAYDALMAAGTKKTKAAAYTPEFEAAWDAYPARPGNSKAAAFKAWKARIAAGATPLEMIEGTHKYAAYCKAKGTEPEFVKQAATFFGPGEHFSADWTVATGRLEARWPFPASSQGRVPLAQQQMDATRQAASEEAKRRLRGNPPDDGMTIDMVP